MINQKISSDLFLSRLTLSLKYYPSRLYFQGLYQQSYPEIGKRWMANCDIPDLDLFPNYYGIKDIQFFAGLESTALHLTLWALSWLVRFGLPINLTKHATFLLKLSHLFDYFGSSNGGMHMIISGKDHSKNPKTIKWFIIAKNGSGTQIPAIPAIILTKKLINYKINQTGAMPCMNLITLEEYFVSFPIKETFQN